MGINAAVSSEGQGIGFAIPINVAKSVLEQLRDHRPREPRLPGHPAPRARSRPAEAARPARAAGRARPRGPEGRRGGVRGPSPLRRDHDRLRARHRRRRRARAHDRGHAAGDAGHPRCLPRRQDPFRLHASSRSGKPTKGTRRKGRSSRRPRPPRAGTRWGSSWARWPRGREARRPLPADRKGVVVRDVVGLDPGTDDLEEGDLIVEVNRQPTPDAARLPEGPGHPRPRPVRLALRLPSAARRLVPDPGGGREAAVKPRVLIVDDEEAIRSSLKMIFEYEGYEVLLAANGPAGLKMAEKEDVDLVFLDIKMPQMDGIDVLKRIKAADGVAAGGHPLRARHGQDRGGGDQARGLRLHREAAGERAHPARGPKRARPQEAARREPAPAADLRRALSPGGVERRPGEGRGGGASRRPHQRHRPHHRGERGGQGAGGAGHPPQQPAQGRGLRAGQLRGHTRGADRERAVRAREGVVHGGHREAGGKVRAGAQGDDLPGRGGGHEPAHPGQGPARAPGRGGRAHRLAEDDPGGRARHRRHQQATWRS